MLNQFQRYGQKSEEIAAAYLTKRGYTILQRNFRTRLGEIDIIARDGPTIVFVEVKARKTEVAGSVKACITEAKKAKITRVAQYYLKKFEEQGIKVRFDVVTIKGDGESTDLFKNAFEAVLG